MPTEINIQLKFCNFLENITDKTLLSNKDIIKQLKK
jgi:hypothetical protein